MRIVLVIRPMRSIFFILAILMAQPVQAAASSGLPIPRFVALRNDETNVRTGPGTRYPIQWVYRRAGMPVEVIEEYDLWRKVRDMDGTTGWVHKTLVDGRRNALVRGKEPRLVRIDADAASKPMLKVEPIVIVRLLECLPEWCRIQVEGRKGWIEKKFLWGVYPEEIFD